MRKDKDDFTKIGIVVLLVLCIYALSSALSSEGPGMLFGFIREVGTAWRGE
jgi:hypothetical protein